MRELFQGPWLLALAAASAVSGCFAVADLDRFEPTAANTSQEDDPNAASDLKLVLRGMNPHVQQLIEFRIVDRNNDVQSRGIIEPVSKPSSVEISFNVPKGVPSENAPYRLDFYADVSGSRTFEGLKPEGLDPLYRDHAWRVEPLVDYPAGAFPHVANVVRVVFTHTKLFTDINEWPEGKPNPPRGPGGDVLLRFSAVTMAEFVGGLLQVRVSEVNTGHVVGLYRNPEVPATDFQGTIPDAVEPGEAYNVDVYVDANHDGAYESPTGFQESVDRVWRFPIIAGTTGDAAPARASIILDFDPSVPSAPLDIGEP